MDKTLKQTKKTKASPAAAVPGRGSPRPTAPAHQFHRALWLANILRERIVRGIYQPGARIREADLRGEFGFSNGPIREALQLIVADGLAQRSPWQGVSVISLTETQIIELFEIRLALLEYAAEFAASRASPETLAAAPTLKRHIDDELEEIQSGRSHSFFHGELSDWLMQAAGNEKLQALWQPIVMQTLVYVNTAISRDAGAHLRPLMHHLIDNVVAGDRPAARAAARKLTQQMLHELGIHHNFEWSTPTIDPARRRSSAR